MAKTRNFDPFNFYPSAEFSMYFFFCCCCTVFRLTFENKDFDLTVWLLISIYFYCLTKWSVNKRNAEEHHFVGGGPTFVIWGRVLIHRGFAFKTRMVLFCLVLLSAKSNL